MWCVCLKYEVHINGLRREGDPSASETMQPSREAGDQPGKFDTGRKLQRAYV